MSESIPAPDSRRIRAALRLYSVGKPLSYRPLVRVRGNGELECEGYQVNCERGWLQFDVSMVSYVAGVWKPLEPAVWPFSSTDEAYAQAQVRDDLWDGDVLVIENESVIGYLDKACPIALTEARGEFHRPKYDPRTYGDGRYAASVRMAEREAARLGIPLTRANKDATTTAPTGKKEN